MRRAAPPLCAGPVAVERASYVAYSMLIEPHLPGFPPKLRAVIDWFRAKN